MRVGKDSFKVLVEVPGHRRLIEYADGTWEIEIPREFVDEERGPWEACGVGEDPRIKFALFILAMVEDLAPSLGLTARMQLIPGVD